MRSETEKKRKKIKNAYLTVSCCGQWGPAPLETLGNNMKHASKYYQKGKEAGIIILRFPSITGWGMLPEDYLPSTSSLPCMQVRKSKAESQVLAGHVNAWTGMVRVSAAKSHHQKSQNLNSFFVTVSLQRRSAFLTMQAIAQNFEV